MDTESWKIADLTEQELQKIMQLEPQIKNSAGKDIVLIAYQRK